MSPKSRVREALDKFVARVRHNMDVHLEALAVDLAKAVDGDGVTPGEAQKVVEEIARLAARMEPADARSDGFARLVAAVRLLDEATTLRGTLDGLARGAGSEAACVSVLMVDGDTLRSFSEFGFAGVRRPVDVPVDSFSVLARAVSDRQRITLPGGEAAQRVDVPAFLRPAAGHTAVLIPLQVSGKVVALVFAEGTDRQSPAGAGAVWSEHVEVLVRHASSRLENVTSRRTVEVLTTPA